MFIGAKIRELRLERGIRQNELARLAGISNTYLSDIENGRANPSVNTFLKIARVLDANCDGILVDNEAL